MTLLDIIKELEKQGHTLVYHHRKDGGYVISKIDGMSFSGKTGNAQARAMVGATLSEARAYQLKRIRTPKGKRATKRTPLPKELKKMLTKVQRAHRKKHPTSSGTISTRGVRWFLEHYGEEAAKQAIDKAWRYSQGYAYLENVQTLIERINLDLNKNPNSAMEQVKNEIENKMMVFKEEWIQHCYEALYEWEKGAIEGDECARRIRGIIK